MQKKVPYVAQLGNMDCSIACMTMLFRYYGLDVDIVDVGQVEYTVALLGKGNAQVVRGSRFARTALLVCDSNSFHLVSSSKISSKLIQCFWYSCVTCTSVSL